MAPRTMKTVEVDGKTYEMDSLSDEARAQVNNVAFCDNKMAELNGEIAMIKTARAAYMANLLKALPKDS